MALNRIQLSDDASGLTGLYTFPINPIELDVSDGLDQAEVQIIDDVSVFQRKALNGAIQRMSWDGPIDKADARVVSIVTTLRGYINNGDRTKYLNLRDIDAYSWGTKKIFLVNFTTKVAKAGGVAKYESMTLEFVLAD